MKGCARIHGFVWALGVVLVAGMGCGKKGPPLAPLRPEPARVDDLTIRRIVDDVYLQFTLPARNADGTTPADLERVEAYAITGRPVQPDGQPLDAKDFLKYGAAIGDLEAEPPPPPPPKEGPVPPPPLPDPRPSQGERVVLREVLSPAVRTPFQHPLQKAFDQARAIVEPPEQPSIGPLVIRLEEPTARVYAVVGRSKRRTTGPLSTRLSVPLTPAPDAPAGPTVRYDESRLWVEWAAPASARLPIQAPPAQTASVPGGTGVGGAVPLVPLAGRPLFAGANPHTYNVYEIAPGASIASTTPTPINPRPLDRLSFEDTRLTFGVARCYAVRMVEALAGVTVESAASPATCVTPRDTFAPAAPRNLAAVGAEGAVSLIWESNTEKDLAGYLVLRGPIEGGRLEALAPTPIRETTFRDASVVPGVRYVYAIVAVDTASPSNTSVESNRVEEGGR